MRERKERIGMQRQIEIDKEDLYTLKINCKGKRAARKANKEVNVEKVDWVYKIKIIKKTEEERNKDRKREPPQNCKSPM